MKFKTACWKCHTVHTFDVPDEDLRKWRDGALIQDAMPYFEPEVRELLISNTCPECFKKLFGEET